MSHIIFGDCTLSDCGREKIKELKRYSWGFDVYYWFEEEITFYPDVLVMLKENDRKGNLIKFCITSKNQKYNSEDLLLPYDKYTKEELFPDENDRVIFEELCGNNLDILFDTLSYFLKELKPKRLRIFVTEGYDCEFEVVRCDLKSMLKRIREQSIAYSMIDSTIYELI